MRELAWEGCVNVRDLGGLGDIRDGAVVRMEQPAALTEVGWAAAWDHGVRTVIDLRDPGERTADSAPRPDGITTVHAPLDPVGTPFYERWQHIDHLASPLHYPAMLAEHPHPVVTAVRAVASAKPGGVAIHCAGGKDRTGLVCLVLLAFAGASADEIADDYLLSFPRMQPTFDAMGVRDQLTVVRQLCADHGTTIEESVASTVADLDTTHLLTRGGMSNSEITALRTRILTTADRSPSDSRTTPPQ